MLSDYTDLGDLARLAAAILTVDTTVLFLARYFPQWIGVKTLNDWYDQFGIVAVLSDCLVILLVFIIARYIYSLLGLKHNLFLFLLLVVALQVLHDIFFYVAVIKPIPRGHNKMIDVFKNYSDENGAQIIVGDAGLMLASAAIALLFNSQPDHVVVAITTVVGYALTYILYTKRQ
jgi:hypothetical protein